VSFSDSPLAKASRKAMRRGAVSGFVLGLLLIVSSGAEIPSASFSVLVACTIALTLGLSFISAGLVAYAFATDDELAKKQMDWERDQKPARWKGEWNRKP